MLQSSLQALHPSRAPPPSPVIDLESQLPESQAQPSVTIYNQEISRTQETQPLHFTAVDTEILLQTAQSQASTSFYYGGRATITTSNTTNTVPCHQSSTNQYGHC
jgi:hypothetical protein